MSRSVFTLSCATSLLIAVGSPSPARDGPGPIVYRVPGMDRVVVKRDLVYKRAGGTDLAFDLFLPAGDTPSGGWPVVVLIHGGPVPPGVRPKDWPAFESFGRVLAASGLGAVTFNYRFPSTAALPQAAGDVDDLLGHLRDGARGWGLDPDRVGLWAFSGGGPQLSVALRGPRPSIRCLVSFYAPLDAPRGQEEYSPLAALRARPAAVPPTLIARMGKDSPEINRSVDEFVREARRLGAPVEVVGYPEGVHAFDIAQDTDESRAVIAKAIAFARRHLRGAPDPDGDGEFEALRRQFDYDAQAPLAVEAKPLYERDGVKVRDVTYASPAGGRVTAYLVEPPGPGPHAGLVFGHWGPGDRTEFLPEATLYARAGAVSLLVDYPWVRPAPWHKRLRFLDDPESDHAAFVQAVVDLRRGLDLVATRPDVDPKRLAYVGHSYGAQWGAILAAVDDRPRGVVLMGGVPDAESIYRDGPDPGLAELRANTPKEKLEEFFRAHRRTAAVRYVPHARVPLLFQFARHERLFDLAAMERYAAASTGPKSVKWYDTGHDLNDVQALLDRAAWLKERVGLGPIAPALRERLRED